MLYLLVRNSQQWLDAHGLGFLRVFTFVTFQATVAVVESDGPGNVARVDFDGLVEEARRGGCTLELVPMMGDFVMQGAPLFRIRGSTDRIDHDRNREGGLARPQDEIREVDRHAAGLRSRG